ncbi:MAG: DeoR family transcriptional regulator [Candidatus Methanomethylophilaceae archaeon]|nr:DeoR family transcriptional regulator [Candidatus Methanomethylophilaceae archaeon]
MTEYESMADKLKDEIELLARHVRMLKMIKAHQPIGIIRLAEELGIPKHKVRYSLRLLEKEGLIQPSRGGAMVTEGYDDYMEYMHGCLEEMVDQIHTLVSEIPKG